MSFLLTLVFVAYGQLAWSFLLPVETRFGLYGGKSIGLVFFAYGSPPSWKLGLVFFAYGSPRPELGFVFLAYGSPTVSKKDEA